VEFQSEIGYLQAEHSPSFRGKMTNAADLTQSLGRELSAPVQKEGQLSSRVGGRKSNNAPLQRIFNPTVYSTGGIMNGHFEAIG
jgi:hypothetical protein